MSLRPLLPVLQVSALLAAGCGGHASRGATSPGSTAAPTTSGTAPVTSGAAPVSSHTPSWQEVAWETVDVGSDSPRGSSLGAHRAVVTTAADWAFFWTTHSQAALPAVDFTREAVVGDFLGTLPSDGHATRVITVWRDTAGHDLKLRLRTFHPGPWRAVATVVSSPFHLVRCEGALAAPGAVLAEQQTLLDFETLAAGADSAIGANDPTWTGGLELLRDASSLAAFWARHQPGQAPPAVDFQQAMVVAVLGPYIASFGNQVETLRLVHDGPSDTIRVAWRVNGYQGGAAPPPATETPWQVLRVTPASGSIRAEQRGQAALAPLDQGWSTRWTGPSEALVLRDAASLAAVWSARIGTPVPQVDFARDQVLLAFETASTGRQVWVPRVETWEDGELRVEVHVALLGAPSQGAAWAAVTTPRTRGPVGFEWRDVTPRP